MRNYGKKFLAFLLALCMLAGIMPFGALAAEASAEVVGQQLMLGDDLCMHFYVTVSDASNAVATISVGGTERAAYNIAEMSAGENGYDLSVDMGAPEMTEDISLVISDGTEEILNKTYSVQDYAHYLLENNYTDETKALAKELLNYGAKAQTYFAHKTDDLANASYEMETAAVISTEVPEVTVSDKLAGISYHGSSMVFESKIAVRFYFYALNGVDGYTFTVDGDACTPISKDGYYYIEATGINPDQMDTALAVSVTKDTGTLTLSYSPMNYITRMYNKESSSQALKDMLKAANGYFQAAKVFTGVAENRTGSLSMQYSYGTNNLIQVKTDLPSDTPCVSFTTADNGCSIDESANLYQNVGWVGMDLANDAIYLAFHFNGIFEAGQTYTLPKGAVFGFTDNSKYTLDKNYTFTFDGSTWSMVAEEPAINLTYRYGTNQLIQFNTDLPSDTPCVNFTTGQNGCVIDESSNKYQNVGWIGMENVDGVIVLTFHFNSAFTVGQNYILPEGALFGFTDGSKYQLSSGVDLYWNGSEWSEDAPTISFQYRYGTNTLIQVNTDLPSDIPCASFTASDNGCSIDQSANTVQWFGWAGMDNVDGTIVITFHFNSAFTAGQTYVLPAGAVFGFTNGNLYRLDTDYTFTYDGSVWSMEAAGEEPEVTEPEATEPEATEPEETEPEMPSLSFQYRYGTSTLIQVNTDLPASTPIADFTTDQNGCSIDQSGNTVQWVGWIAMANVDGIIVLTFNFNSAFTAGQTYVLPKGAVFGFTDGNTYALDGDYTFTFDGSSWTMSVENKDEPEESYVNFQYRYGTNQLIQFNTDLPSDTPCVNFTTDDNDCTVIQSGDQSVGWIGMENVDGTVVLTFHFNAVFTTGQSYTLSAGSVFGFTNGSSYTVPEDITLYWDGSAWTAQEPAKQISLSYRYGADMLIQFNTNLPATTTLKDFLATDNGCSITQSGDQQVGYISMANADGTIVLTFNFNSAFTSGQSYGLTAGSVFGFTDGSSYVLDKDYTFYFDGSAWDTDPVMTLAYRYGESKLIQFNTNLPATTPCVNFTTGENGCSIDESANQYQNVGWIAMANADGTIVLTFNFNAEFTYGQSYCLPKGAVFGFTDGSSYKLDRDYTFYWDGSSWSETEPAPQVDVLDESNFTGGEDFTTFADIPADYTNVEKIEEYKGLGFNTSLIAEDHIGGWGEGADKYYSASLQTANAPAEESDSALTFSLNSSAAKYIQLKTNIPTGLTYGDFLLGDTSAGHNVILETTEGAQAVAWFSYSELDGAVYLTFNFSGYNKAGTQYILKAGTALKAGDNTYTTDRDYILTVENTYLNALENLNNAGLNIWVRNYTNKTGYFDEAMTAALLLYQDVIDGFYMVDEAFETSELLEIAGQQDITTDFQSLAADVVEWFKTNFAGKYFHSNHVPITSYDHYTDGNGNALSEMNADYYKKFLETYKATFNDQLTSASGSSISFDNYPFIHAQGEYGGFLGIGATFESGIQDTYLLNCLIAAQVAGEYDFGLCVQTFEASDLTYEVTRDITSAAEVSLQLYTGMAMGADVFEYFAYGSDGNFNAIMNADGSKRIYDIVKEGNNALCFADVVNTFTWNGIVTSAGSTNNDNTEAFSSVADMVLTDASNGVLSSYSSTDDAIIGCFTKGDLNGYMVVNFNDPLAVTGNNTVTVSFADCTRARVYTCVDGVLTSELVELTDGVCTVTLAPGSGCFIIPA